MDVIIVLLGVALFDRAIPMGAFRFNASALRVSEAEYMRRYGWFRLPRTLFATGIVLVTAAGYIVPINREVQGFVAVALAILFASAAAWDAWRAASA